MFKSIKTYRFVISLSLTLLLVTSLFFINACSLSNEATEDDLQYSCIMPQSNNLSLSVIQSKETLSYDHCQLSYRYHFKRLVKIAAGSPSDENLEILADFSKWSANQGIISKKQSEQMLRRYFSPTLVSLEYHSDFNTYSHCSMSTLLPEIKEQLMLELEQKKLGLADALGDVESYRSAVKEYQSLSVLLESTSQACLDKS
jgi:hypothetical protein